MAKSAGRKLLQKAVHGEISDPQLAELVSHFFSIAGGPRQVARMLWDEYQVAKAGSLIRNRILDMILRVTRYANEKAPPVNDLGMLSEKDLDQEIESLISQLPAVSEEDEPLDGS